MCKKETLPIFIITKDTYKNTVFVLTIPLQKPIPQLGLNFRLKNLSAIRTLFSELVRPTQIQGDRQMYVHAFLQVCVCVCKH